MLFLGSVHAIVLHSVTSMASGPDLSLRATTVRPIGIAAVHECDRREVDQQLARLRSVHDQLSATRSIRCNNHLIWRRAVHLGNDGPSHRDNGSA